MQNVLTEGLLMLAALRVRQREACDGCPRRRCQREEVDLVERQTEGLEGEMEARYEP